MGEMKLCNFLKKKRLCEIVINIAKPFFVRKSINPHFLERYYLDHSRSTLSFLCCAAKVFQAWRPKESPMTP